MSLGKTLGIWVLAVLLTVSAAWAMQAQGVDASQQTPPAAAARERSPRVALGGERSRGFAHLGVLQVLEQGRYLSI